MLKAYVGPMGGGKTALMTYDLLFDYARKRKIWANYNLNFPHEKVFADDIYNEMVKGFSDSHVALDEGWMYFDSRRSGSKGNLKMDQFFLQSRKLNVDISATAQSFMQFDKRFRDNCHYVIECNTKGDLCYFTIFNYNRGTTRAGRINLSTVYDLYDTNQIIIPGMKREQIEAVA